MSAISPAPISARLVATGGRSENHYTELSRSVVASGLMRRRYAYY